MLFADNVAAQDGAIVAMLRRAGAIVVGMTNVSEWGAGGNTRNALHGATGNPFDPERSAAGSSGGSAIALATGMVPLATGSDTGGLVRNPAAFCGVVGFRPSPGRQQQPQHGLATDLAARTDGTKRTGCPGLLHAGARRARSASAILHAGGSPDAAGYCDPARIDLGNLLIAATTDFGFAPTERMVADAFKSKLAAFGSAFRSANPETARPIPNLAWLRRQPSMSSRPGFRDFD